MSELEALRAELDRVKRVIERVEDPVIEQEGRDIHDWLAQILQVLVMDGANAVTERDKALAENRTLRDALLKLANEASGFLELAREVDHGVTNIRVLKLRIDEARTLLNPPAQEVKGS